MNLLVGCVKTKSLVPGRAAEVYSKSRIFFACQQLALRRGYTLLILSGKHGWITPDTWIEPYDQIMPGTFQGPFPAGEGYYYGSEKYFKHVPSSYAPLVASGRGCGDQYSALVALLEAQE